MAKYFFKINKNDSGQSISRFLRKTLSDVPATKIYSLIRKHEVRVNNQVVKNKNLLLKELDFVQIFLKSAKIAHRSPELENVKIDLTIIHENKDLLVVDKKPGVIVHGEENCLDNQILKYLIKKSDFNPNQENTFVPSHFYRLDKVTSGIMIYAKNASVLREAKARINDSNYIEKKYLAVVSGNWNTKKTIFEVLMKKTNYGVIVSDLGKTTKTVVHVVKNWEDQKKSLLQITLKTGHKHQIRVLLSHLGFPVVGDNRYGSQTDLKNKIALWAYEINLQGMIFKSLYTFRDFEN